jgi:hypothetical protein
MKPDFSNCSWVTDLAYQNFDSQEHKDSATCLLSCANKIVDNPRENKIPIPV